MWAIDYLKFVGQDSDFVTAIVYDISWKPEKSGYTQIVSYEFEIEGHKYDGSFKGNNFTVAHKVGDKLNVKFAVNNPFISKRMATYKSQ